MPTYPASLAPLSGANAITSWPGGYPILGGKRRRNTRKQRKNARRDTRKHRYQRK